MLRIAHDVRQFITIILGNCDLIEQACPHCAPSKSLGDIRKSSQRIKTILEEAVAEAENKAVATSAVGADVNAIIRELSGLEVLRKEMEVRVELDPDVRPLARGSAIAIHRLLVNLCSNARHAMVQTVCGVYEEGSAPRLLGTLTIGTRRMPGAFAAVFVSDTGAGMDPIQRQRVLDRMNAGGEAIEAGHGHGLQIVKATLDSIGGRIHVKSAPGEGTTFTIMLPTVDEAAGTAAA